MAGQATEIRLDTTDLEPPEPLVRALAAVAGLHAGEYLRMVHRRDPLLLYPELEARGCNFLRWQHGQDEYVILIWRRGDAVAEQACQDIARNSR